jgi:hypothetical protein
MPSPIVSIRRNKHRTLRLCPRRTIQRVASTIILEQRKRVVRRPAVRRRVRDPDLAVVVQRRGALVHGSTDGLPIFEGLGENVRFTDCGGGVEGRDAVALDPVGHAGPDKVVLRVHGQDCSVNAPFRGYLAEISVLVPGGGAA